MNSYISQHIQIPISIGLQQLKSLRSQKSIKLDSLAYELEFSLKNDQHLKQIIQNKIFQTQYQPDKSQILLCNYKIVSQKKLLIYRQKRKEDLLDLRNSDLNRIQQFAVYLKNYNEDNSEQIGNDKNNFKFSYRIQFQCNGLSKKYKLHIFQQNISFSLAQINSNVKLVKNPFLANLLNSKCQQQTGLLSMDQQKRILLDTMKMQYPVIGFWLKSDKQIQSIEMYDYFSKFLKHKFEKKCFFRQKQSKRLYFYFLLLNSSYCNLQSYSSKCFKNIQVYLVSFQFGQTLKKSFILSNKMSEIDYDSASNKFNQKIEAEKQNYEMKITQNQNNFLFGSNSWQISNGSNGSKQSNKDSTSKNNITQENGMQFTLRKNKNRNQFSTLQSLINYSYLSPIKQLDQNNNENFNTFFSNHQFQNSPQFSTLTKDAQFQNQCQQLRLKVKNQEEEIQNLKKIIEQMQYELKIFKNSSRTTASSNSDTNKKNHNFIPAHTKQILSPQISQFTLNQNKESLNSSPKDIRRLRESDLKSNSMSKGSDWLKNSSTKKKFELKHQQRSSNSKQSSNKQANSQNLNDITVQNKSSLAGNLGQSEKSSAHKSQNLINFNDNQSHSVSNERYFCTKKCNDNILNQLEHQKIHEKNNNYQFSKEKNENLYEQLPQITQERDPWDYMQIVQD